MRGQGDVRACAAAVARAERESAAVQLGQHLGDGEAEPEAVVRAAVGVAALGEGLHHLIEGVRVHAGAAVEHAEERAVVVARGGLQGHAAAVR